MTKSTILTSTEFISLIRLTTKNAISTYLKKRVKQGKKSEHVILDRIFPIERQVRSLMGGLETSLGTTLWEPLAVELAKSNGFTHLKSSDFTKPTNIPQSVTQIIQKWGERRLVNQANVRLGGYVSELQQHVLQLEDYSQHDQIAVRKGEGVDVWLEKEGVEYAFDIKTVQTNAKNGNSFNTTIMQWYAYRILNKPSVKFQARIAFPYSPFKPYTIESLWKKSSGRLHPLKRGEDVWTQEEFWNFLSGRPDSWILMLQAFDELRDSGFGDELREIFYSELE